MKTIQLLFQAENYGIHAKECKKKHLYNFKKKNKLLCMLHLGQEIEHYHHPDMHQYALHQLHFSSFFTQCKVCANHFVSFRDFTSQVVL